VLVNRAYEPIDQTEMDLLVEQNKKAVGDGRNPLEDFCVVYLPPHIRIRVRSLSILMTVGTQRTSLIALCFMQTYMLLFSLWVSLVVLIGASLSVPLVIGRFFFDVVLEKEVHDGYSFAVSPFECRSIAL
jgi:E3 ubiquitin-protein ligase MARCH6